MPSNILETRRAAGQRIDDKTPSASYGHELEQEEPVLASTGMDILRMRKLGIQQETKRRFGLVTILAFTTTMMCTWESAIPQVVTHHGQLWAPADCVGKGSSRRLLSTVAV